MDFLEQIVGEGYSSDRLKRLIDAISTELPVNIDFVQLHRDIIDIYIVGIDFPGVFSLIAGILLSYDISILYGVIHSYEAYEGRRGIIVDRLRVKFPSVLKRTQIFDRIRSDVREIFNLLASRKEGEARRNVYERVADYIKRHKHNIMKILMPINVEVSVDEKTDEIVLHIEGKDTIGFLFSLSTALYMRGYSISRLYVKTVGEEEVNDRIYVKPIRAKKVDYKELQNLKSIIAIIKQFSYFISNAVDPLKAMLQFEKAIDLFLEKKDIFRSYDVFKYFASTFGVSEFLWEDFLRFQHKNLLQVFKDPKKIIPFKRKDEYRDRLYSLLNGISPTDIEGFKRVLNNFKDREMFKIDIYHILSGHYNFREFSLELTYLADVVLSFAYNFAIRYVASNMGYDYSDDESVIFGLGKFGGEELGYASDIEIMFIYRDDVEKLPTQHIFYEEVIKVIRELIISKRDGIFSLDFRLRPYGKDGPYAVSLSSFRDYYLHKKGVYEYERQSLIKMRYVVGSNRLSREVLQVRDKICFFRKSIDKDGLRHIRAKQILELGKKNGFNAKFSKGGLVDVEYTVQYLQMKYGGEEREVRTGNTLIALKKLFFLGYISRYEYMDLKGAYIFFRKLINALRIVRGNAKDLVVKDDNDEKKYLAKRMGYVATTSVVDILDKDIEYYSKVAYSYYKRYLYDDMSDNPDLYRMYKRIRFEKPLKVKDWERFIGLVFEYVFDISHRDILEITRKLVNPYRSIMAFLDFVDRYQKQISKRKFEIFMLIVSYSEYAMKLFLKEPNFIEVFPEKLQVASYLNSNYFKKVLDKYLSEYPLEIAIRLYKSHIFLFILSLDLYYDIHLKQIVFLLSRISDIVIERVLDKVKEEFSLEDRRLLSPIIVGMGKYGGLELNYSSDIDLMFFYNIVDEEEIGKIHSLHSRLLERFIRVISDVVEYGFFARLDFDLRPWGYLGDTVQPIDFAVKFYKKKDIKEAFALLKFRRVYGILPNEFFDSVFSLLFSFDEAEIKGYALKIRKKLSNKIRRKGEFYTNIKLKPGGIRDIEFIVYVLLLKHKIFCRNFFLAVERLEREGIISPDEKTLLLRAYKFYRNLEHILQIEDNLQIYNLPKDEHKFMDVVYKMHIPEFGVEVDRYKFERYIRELERDIRGLYEKFIGFANSD